MDANNELEEKLMNLQIELKGTTKGILKNQN